ncbi:MAG TPA: hypothetical protein VGR48_01250 [Terriglobales bacterium]|nr:hypothetical protein [Terriglobales bacterium]
MSDQATIWELPGGSVTQPSSSLPWLGNAEIAADVSGREGVDFTVSRNSSEAITRGIAVHAVFAVVADQSAAMRLQIRTKSLSFIGGLSHGDGDFLANHFMARQLFAKDITSRRQ